MSDEIKEILFHFLLEEFDDEKAVDKAIETLLKLKNERRKRNEMIGLTIKKILRLKDVKHPGKLLLIHILDKANSDGECELSISDAVEEISIAKTTIKNELNSLMRQEILIKTKRTGHCYRIDFDKL